MYTGYGTFVCNGAQSFNMHISEHFKGDSILYQIFYLHTFGNGRFKISNIVKLGPPKSLVPLIAVVQYNKGKVCQVMDYHEINEHIDAFTANMDVCSAKLQDW